MSIRQSVCLPVGLIAHAYVRAGPHDMRSGNWETGGPHGIQELYKGGDEVSSCPTSVGLEEVLKPSAEQMPELPVEPVPVTANCSNVLYCAVGVPYGFNKGVRGRYSSRHNRLLDGRPRT